MLGVLLLGAAYAALHMPKVRAKGWEAAVPTTAIIVALPVIEPGSHAETLWGPGGAKPKPTLSQRFSREIERRCKYDDLWNWQWSILIERILDDDPRRLGSRTIRRPIRTFRFPSLYSRLLVHAQQLGHLSVQQVRRADATSHLEFDMARQWPAHAPICAAIRTHHWEPIDVRYIVRERGTDAVVLDVLDSYRTSANEARVLARDWAGDHKYPLGTAVNGMTQLGFSIDMSVREGGDEWRHVRTYDTELPIEVDGSIDE